MEPTHDDRSPTSVTPATKQKIDESGSPPVSIHKRTYQACVGCAIPSSRQNVRLTYLRFRVGVEKYAVT